MDGLSQRRHSVLVDEVLHCILFLGHINKPQYTPEDILDHKLNEYKGRYPKPFNCYTTHLPKRAPISCVLEMTDEDWDKVKKGAVGRRLDEAHHELVTTGKSKFLEDLKSMCGYLYICCKTGQDSSHTFIFRFFCSCIHVAY
ncbi:hypothetical protein GBF38_010965 [Nibea albiflora]|uniref:Uncharacterized protein n=1 Tax=Nibea albiflora TaxID=240163 RepID=A0ACB7ET08_NIBAL|nr:hypothetical protein GBF38_010965 [Nibea albiflora]